MRKFTVRIQDWETDRITETVLTANGWVQGTYAALDYADQNNARLLSVTDALPIINRGNF